jgi:hypothetical protein
MNIVKAIQHAARLRSASSAVPVPAGAEVKA